MIEFASINGERVVRAIVSIPYRGRWSADIEIASDKVIASSATLTIANLTLKGTAIPSRSAAFAGARSLRMVGGANGWPTIPTAQAYADPNGVKKTMVTRDAAAAVGEQVNIAQDGTIGTHFVRSGDAPAIEVVRSVFGETWWIDEKGVTQCQDRTNTAIITTPFTVAKRNGAKASFEVATEDLASWMPARTFRSDLVPDVQSISLVTLNLEGEGKLRLDILAAA